MSDLSNKKFVGTDDVLRCLAKNLIWMPSPSGKYYADAKCNKCSRVQLCIKLRDIIEKDKGV